MAIKTTAQNLSVVLEKMLSEYTDEVRRGVKKDGQVVDTIVGYHSKDQLKQLLSQYVEA